jgi:hypothetical protein
VLKTATVLHDKTHANDRLDREINQPFLPIKTAISRDNVISRSAIPNWVPVLTPIILTTQEAEIRKIAVRGQPRQTVLETLSQKYPTQKKGLAEWLKW